MKQAPLFTQTYTFFNWLLGHMEKRRSQPFLRQTILETGRRLLDSLTLALQGFDMQEQACRADEALALLRLHLRLGEENHLLSRKQYAFAVQNLDEIGRQLGGWLKSMRAL